MIKRVIGVLAVLVSLAVMVSVALHCDRFSSMVVIDEPAVPAADETPAAPAVEEPDSGERPVVPEMDSVRNQVRE